MKHRPTGMSPGIHEEHWHDHKGNPAGGVSSGRGIAISWQNGPLGRHGSKERKEPNGAFVADVLEACRGRIEHFQEGKFACNENEQMLYHIKEAIALEKKRTQRRINEGTEGTHEGN